VANSSSVSSGQQATAAQHNALRDDILSTTSGHLHDGSNGRAHTEFTILADEGDAAIFYMKADQGDDAGDEWRFNIADAGVMTIGNDIASAGTYVTHLTITPNSTITSSSVTFPGILDVNGSVDWDVSDVQVDSSGDIDLVSTNDAAAAIYLRENAGTSGTIKIHADQGTSVTEGAESINILSDAGGVGIRSTANLAKAINITSDGGTTGSISIFNDQGTSVTEGAESISLLSDAGGVGIRSTANLANAVNITVDGGTTSSMTLFNDQGTGATEGSASIQLLSDVGGINLKSGLNGANAILLTADGGTSETIVIHADQGTGTGSIELLSDAGGIELDAGTDIILDADGGDVFLKDGGTLFGTLTNNSGELLIKSSSSGTAAATFSGANVTFAGTVDATTDFTIGSTVITDDSIVMTPSSSDTVTVAAATNGVLNITTVDNAAAAANLNFVVDGAVDVDAAGAINLDSGSGIWTFEDSGTEVLRFTEGNSGDVTVKLVTNAKDLVFTDNGDATNMKILDGAAGINVPGEVQTTGIGYTDGDNAMTIADGGAVTFPVSIDVTGSAGIILENDETITNSTNGYVALSGSLTIPNAGTIGSAGDADSIAIASDGVVTMNQIPVFSAGINVSGGTIAGTIATATQNSITTMTGLVTTGTIGTGVWQGTAIASAYLDSDTAHLSTTQTFTGAKTFTNTVTVGVDDDGKDVKFFGETAGSYMLWDESEDDLILAGVPKLFIGDTANDNQTIGLTINAAGNEGEIITLKASDFGGINADGSGHDMEAKTESDTYGFIGKSSSTQGGLVLKGYSSAKRGMQLVGAATTDDTAKDVNANSHVVIRCETHDPSGDGDSTTTPGTDANLLTVRGPGGTVRFIWDIEGSAHADVEWTTYDKEDDLGLVKGMEQELLLREDEGQTERRKYLETVGIIGKNSWHMENGKQRAMINTTKLSMLHHGALIQVAEKLDRLSEENIQLKQKLEALEV